MYASDSIELLTKSGLQFKKHETDGIDPMVFSELFITSGFVLSDRIKWLSFHRWVIIITDIAHIICICM